MISKEEAIAKILDAKEEARDYYISGIHVATRVLLELIDDEAITNAFEDFLKYWEYTL